MGITKKKKILLTKIKHLNYLNYGQKK